MPSPVVDAPPASEQTPAAPPRKGLRHALPGVWEMLRPHRAMLLGGLVLIIVNRLAGFGLPLSTKFLLDSVLAHHKVYLLAPIVLGLLGATLIQALTSFALSQLLSKAAWRLITDLRIQVQEHIGRLPIAFYDANRTGTLVSRIMSDVEGLRNLVGTGIVEFLGGVITAGFTFIALLWMNVKLTLMVFTIMAIFVAVMKWWFGTLGPLYKRRAVMFADVTGRLNESLGGVRVVKSYRAEKREAEVFARGARELLDNHLHGITNNSLMGMSSTVVIGVVASLVMFFGARSVIGNAMTLGDYMTYTVFLAFMVAPLFQVVSIATQLTEAIAGLARTREILSEPTEDSDPRRVRRFPPSLNGEVLFDQICFSYEQGKPVLHDISFSAPPGSVTALVGPSGSGKSTIINLVNAFHTPDSGTILVDGVDLTTVELDSFRCFLGVVLQESFLFDGTIRDNILFSRPDASESQMLEAARIARVEEFVEKLPEGYHTIVGERGVKLSGGQRQRLSIARAILADPRILILDEATSSLDSESEALIQEGLAYLMRGRTTFVIAHRLSTIRQADQILFLEEGVVRERGTHDELIAAQGRYYDLYTRQYALESNLFLAPGEGDSIAQEESAYNGNANIPSFSQALRGAQ